MAAVREEGEDGEVGGVELGAPGGPVQGAVAVFCTVGVGGRVREKLRGS